MMKSNQKYLNYSRNTVRNVEYDRRKSMLVNYNRKQSSSPEFEQP